MTTESEKKEIVRVCGPDYEESDIPAYIRQRDLNGENWAELHGARQDENGEWQI